DDPVSGAVLRLAGTDEKGNLIKFTLDQFVTAEDLKVELVDLEVKTVDGKKVYSEKPLTEGATEGTAVVWTTGTKNIKFTGLKNGTYTLRETAAPEGFNLAHSVTFIVENGQLVQIDGDLVESDTVVTMIDTSASSIGVSKRDITGSRKVAGATLTLTGFKDADGKTPIVFKDGTQYITVDGSAKLLSQTGTAVSWITGSKPVELMNLEDGFYTLHEEKVPTGYQTAKDIKFEVKDGKINQDNLVALNNDGDDLQKMDSIDDNDETYLKNSKNRYVIENNTFVLIDQAYIEVGKTDTDGNLLSGATFLLMGEESATKQYTITSETLENRFVFPEGTEYKIVNASVDTTGKITIAPDENLEEGTGITWTSSDKERTLIKNLHDGTYRLYEITAPDGYKITDRIRFTIKGGKLATIKRGSAEEETYKASETFNGFDMVDEKVSITVSKQDGNKNSLKGAKLSLKGQKDGKDIDLSNVTIRVTGLTQEEADGLKQKESTSTEIVWLSSGKDRITFAGLPNGDYTLHEIEAPVGYKKAEDIKFTIKNGEVETSEGIKQSAFTLIDEKISITVSKQKEDKKSLEGATLSLTGKGLDNVKLTTIDTEGNTQAVNPIKQSSEE
ncbi:MAG: hypothetical protein K2H85_05530, partial [Allobaculum sp.]|nr:hypothetical protein [Allobaculum sp.]